ncbi:MAG: hypothetical protein ACM3JD_07555 [Rudaea sp.]
MVVNRVARSLQIEDLLLLVIQVLVGVVLAGTTFTSLGPETPNSWLFGLVFLVASLGAVAALFTRNAGDTDDRFLNMDSPRGYAYFPMMASLGIVMLTASDLLPLPGAGRMLGAAPLLPVVALLIHRWLPAAPSFLRRMLMTPLILVCAWIFTDLVGTLTDGILQMGESAGTSPLQTLGTWSGLIGLAAAVFYMMFIFSPRQIAGEDAPWPDWSIRFLVYMAGMLANLALPRLLRG